MACPGGATIETDETAIHPDLLTSGGIYENKKIGDLAQDYGVAMAVHMRSW